MYKCVVMLLTFGFMFSVYAVTIPKDMKPEDVTEQQAIDLIDARVAKGPAKKRRKTKAKKKSATAK